MIIGEFEILGQTKQALEVAEKMDMVKLPLRHIFNSAIRTGRLVREQTGISRNALSVSSVAVDLSAKVIGDMKNCRMLVIGTGEAGKLAAKVAAERGTSQIVIASRTKERAQVLASAMQGVPADVNNLDNELNGADIIVTCAGAPHRILGFQKIKDAMCNRPGHPLVIIDIAVPRNVEPEVVNIPDVYLYNIDDLISIADLNRGQRENEIHLAEQIIAAEVGEFDSWWHDLEIRPVVVTLMSQAEKIRLAQFNKTLKKLPPLSDEQYESLEAMTKSIVNRILKEPIQYLKTNGNSKHAEIVKELFNLNPEKLQ